MLFAVSNRVVEKCRHFPKALAVIAFILFTSSIGVAEEPEAVPGEFIVKFKTKSKSTQSAVRSTLGVRFLRETKITGTQLVKAENGVSFDDTYAKQLLAEGLVDYIEPNYRITISATPNDSDYSSLWGMHNTGQTGGTNDVDIDAPESWNLSTGSNSVVVGVVDTGINYNHPDLAANIWTNPNEVADNGIDDDGNGVIDDVHGYNAITDSGDPLDDHGHGSHCAGTIGGTGNNSIGVAGVSWNVKMMGLKFLSSSGSGSTQGAIDAINYAVMMKNAGVNLRVLNNSWGGGGYSSALESAISAANSAGILFVAAAGNSALDNDYYSTYPANYEVDNVVSVAALDHNGNLASFSNYGATSVDVAAPGVSIHSTILGSSYASWSGTSMATPHVAGIAGLLLAREPNLTVAQMRSRLLGSYKPLSSLNGVVARPGIMSAYKVLTNETTPEPEPEPVVSYEKSATTFAYSAALGTKVLNVDDGYSAQDLSFPFTFYNEQFSRIAISTNGRVQPLGDSESVPTTADYSNRIRPGMMVYHDDLYPSPLSSEGGVWFKQDSSGATITWVSVNYAHRTTTDSSKEIRFQLKLKSNGAFEYHYFDTNFGDAAFNFGASATIGISPTPGISGEKLTVTHNSTNEAEVGNSKALHFQIDGRVAYRDFDGDGISDIFVWRPGSGMWYILLSGSNFSFDGHQSYQLGLPGDIPLLGHFDGDGKIDLAVWRPSFGKWYFKTSESNYSTITEIQWGLPGDTPITGDYDGDGLTDIAVYRPTAASFYVLLSSSGYNRDGAISGNNQAMIHVTLGGFGHDLVVGDYTGDGKDDFVTVWQPARFWSVKTNDNAMLFSLPWGNPGDTPLACDWDGDGTDDRVITRPNDQGSIDWFIASASGGVYTQQFGKYGDATHCEKDYDGDGVLDSALFRTSTAEWIVKQSSTNTQKTIQFGLPGDYFF